MRARVLVTAAVCAVVTIVAAAVLSLGSKSPSRVVDDRFQSTAVDGTAHFAVYLPTGYDQGHRRYPAVYFLHGLPAGDDEYRKDWIVKIGRAAERTGHPAIVIGAQGARAGDRDPEWHNWGAGRNWETATAKELVSDVDAHYRTIPDRRARALVGLSAGGYGATIIGVHHPETFSVVESWSGYFHATNPDGDAPLELGSRKANRRASVHSYVQRARQIVARYRAFYFGFYVGDGDTRFAAENAQLHRELLAAGVKHAYAHYPGSHTISFWDRHEDDWVARAVDVLTPSG